MRTFEELADAHRARGDYKTKALPDLLKRGDMLVQAAEELMLRLRDPQTTGPQAVEYADGLRQAVGELGAIEQEAARRAVTARKVTGTAHEQLADALEASRHGVDNLADIKRLSAEVAKEVAHEEPSP